MQEKDSYLDSNFLLRDCTGRREIFSIKKECSETPDFGSLEVGRAWKSRSADRGWALPILQLKPPLDRDFLSLGELRAICRVSALLRRGVLLF